jgi:hypothetical protein
MGGYVGSFYEGYGEGLGLEPADALVLQVIEEPGSDAEFLHRTDGRLITREGLTVFATEQEAREDVSRLMREAKRRAEQRA